MQDIPVFERLRMLTAMNYVARCVQVIAELRVADAIGDGAVPIGLVAAQVGAHPEALERMLRLVSGYGLFTVADGRVSHTDMSSLLRSDHPASLRDFARMLGLSVNWRAAEELTHSARTGEAAMLQNVPDGVWSHYAEHPDDARIFDAAMSSRASLMVPAIRRAYDFAQFRTLVDVGGGKAHLLRAVLDDAPETQGVLFDLAHVVDAARQSIGHPRLKFQSGDFFVDPLPQADGYILMEVLHDWPDEAAANIVAAVRHAAPDGARLLVMEIVPHDRPGPAWATTLDIIMLAHFGGKQRTRAEYAELLASHDFSVLQVIDTGSGISIIEAAAG